MSVEMTNFASQGEQQEVQSQKKEVSTQAEKTQSVYEKTQPMMAAKSDNRETKVGGRLTSIIEGAGKIAEFATYFFIIAFSLSNPFIFIITPGTLIEEDTIQDIATGIQHSTEDVLHKFFNFLIGDDDANPESTKNLAEANIEHVELSSEDMANIENIIQEFRVTA